MNSGGGLPPPSAAASPSSSSLAVAVAPPGVGGVPGGAAAGVKLKYCRYYAKDKTCFYGEECQFLHEDPAAGAAPGLGLHSNSVPLALAGAPGAGYPPGAMPSGGTGPPPGPKKPELGGPGSGPAVGGGGGSGVLDGPRLAIPGIDGGALSDTSLTDSYFSTSFIGVNGFGSPVETKYPLMQRMTNSSSSPSLLNDSAKPYAGHDPLTTPASSLFNDFGALNISQRRKGCNSSNNNNKKTRIIKQFVEYLWQSSFIKEVKVNFVKLNCNIDYLECKISLRLGFFWNTGPSADCRINKDEENIEKTLENNRTFSGN